MVLSFPFDIAYQLQVDIESFLWS